MTDARALSPRFSPRLTQWLAFGWTAALAIVWLFRYDAAQWWLTVAHLLPAISIGPHFGEFWLRRLLDAGCVAGLVAAAFGVGAVCIRRWLPETSLLAGLFALAAGLWIVAVAVLALGAISTGHLGWVFVLLLSWAHPAPRSFLRRPRPVVCLFLALIVVAALLNLPGAMAPPFEYDELEYHLGAPTEYLKAGRIIALPHNFYSNLPQLAEMLYLLAMALSSDVAAKLLHWVFGVLTAIAIYAVGARLWSQRAGLTAAALFYCLPFVQDLSQTARIDLATAFFATLAFGALLLDWRMLSALAAGCAVATKWPAVAVVVIPAVALLLWQTRSLRPAVVFCLVASVFVLPWLVKNFIFTGNPIYPLLFGGAHWSEPQAALFAAKHAPSFDAEGLRAFFERAWRYSMSEPGATPVLLMSAPLLLLMRGNCRKLVVLFVAAYAAWYLTTFRPWRFLLPALPLAAWMGALALQRWSRPAVVAVIVTGFASMGATTLVDVGDPQRVPARVSFVSHLLGNQSRDEFIATIGHEMFDPIVWMNENLPDDAKVLYVGEARAHYARHDVLWATAYDQHPILRPQTGITHVYINFSEWQRLGANYDYLAELDTGAFRRWLQESGTLIHTNRRNQVWAMR